MPEVLITDCGFESPDLERSVLEPLGCRVTIGSFKSPVELARLVAEPEFILTVWAPLTAEVIAAMRRARLIVRYGIGVDLIDLEAAARRGIPVANAPDYCIDEVADHTLGFILALTRQIAVHGESVRRGEWKLIVPIGEMKALCDLTVGLAGFGRIGRAVAARLKAFRCRVLVHDPVVDPAMIRQAGCEPVAWADLLQSSDLLSLHLPSTARTRGLIDRGALERMKPGALFVNVSRGALVVTADLVAALQSKRLAAAALDVTDPEPLPPDSPLRTLPNVIVSPHVASASASAARKIRLSVANTVACAVRGERIPNIVNGIG